MGPAGRYPPDYRGISRGPGGAVGKSAVMSRRSWSRADPLCMPVICQEHVGRHPRDSGLFSAPTREACNGRIRDSGTPAVRPA